MRKKQKRQAVDLIAQMKRTHNYIRKQADGNDVQPAMELLEECQNGAIALGTQVEISEGKTHALVALLEEYCECAWQLHESLAEGGRTEWSGLCQAFDQKLSEIEDCLTCQVRERIEAVFLPYKASMWDSLESVWAAANADCDCDAYVIPIPYYDRASDGSFGAMHCETGQFPAEVPVLDWEQYDLRERRPEMIIIHNPYDNTNYVTSVDPFFYSENLKKYTDCLVYIPYYATTGGMAEGQALCPAYLHADYIVTQSKNHRKYFDRNIPDSKFLAFGSPKFDSAIEKCKNPPEPPSNWKEKLCNRTVYFYNTSIGGMLGDTDAFLKKMRYVFDTFKGRSDVCLLWRPHPLLESTFASMRGGYKPEFDALKREFLEEKDGIFDDTPDIESSIALSDVYIGDSGTSVTSLFGVAGKPLFIMSNYIHAEPAENDWRGSWLNPQFDIWGDDRYLLTGNNLLWVSEKNDYHYRFFMDLGSEYASLYYMKAVEIKGKIYVLPAHARHLLVIENRKVRKIELEESITNPGVFWNYFYNDKYIFLFPHHYPYLVRFEIATEKVCYVEGIREFQLRNTDGEWLAGGFAPYGKKLVIASPADSQFAFLDMDTLKVQVMECPAGCGGGTASIVPDGDELWLLPMKGMSVTCWNPKTGAVAEYDKLPKSFRSVKWPYDTECGERPFFSLAIAREGDRETIVIAPYRGNGYLSLDRESGEFSEWKPDVPLALRAENGYFLTGVMGFFPLTFLPQGGKKRMLWDSPGRRLYEADLTTKKCREIAITLDFDEVKAREPGFAPYSEWMPYCLGEGAFNSLKNLLDHAITGNAFDRKRQLEAFSKINADTAGTCGAHVYEFLKGKIGQRVGEDWG